MKQYKLYLFLVVFLAFAYEGCKITYEPEIVTQNLSLLVVEGVLNRGTDFTFFFHKPNG